MASRLIRAKHLCTLSICFRDARIIFEDEIKRIESRRDVFRLQAKKRNSMLTDQIIKDELEKFKHASSILQTRARNKNALLDVQSVSSLLFYKNWQYLPMHVQTHVTRANTRITLHRSSAVLSGFEFSS